MRYKTLLITIIMLLTIAIVTSNITDYNARISPTTAYFNDTLIGYCNATSDISNNISYHFRWYKDGDLVINNTNTCMSGDTLNSDGTCTKTLSFTDDSFVAKNSNTSNNNPNSGLWVSDNTLQATRTFIKIDTTSILNKTVMNTQLILYKTFNGPTGNQYIKVVNDNSWTESAITWNNMPTDYGSILSTNDGSEGVSIWTNWTITSAIQDVSFFGNNSLSLVLITDEIGSASADKYYSNSETYPGYVNINYIPKFFNQNVIEINLSNITNPIRGSNYTFSCNIFDDSSSSGWFNSSTITISNYQAFFNETDVVYTSSHAENFNLKMNGTDYDDNLTYSINDTTHFNINITTGLITKNSNNFTGLYNITVNITDNLSIATTWVFFNITNIAPTFNQSNFTYTLSHSENVSIQINATDIENDTLTYSINDNVNFNINSSTGLITKINNISTVGDYNLTVNVTDGFDTVSMWVFITITNAYPITPSSDITPLVLYKNTTIQGMCYSDDSDNDLIKYYYKWYINNSLNSSGESSFVLPGIEYNVINITNISKNSNIKFECMASDGVLNTTWINSTEYTIQNSAPTISINLTTDNINTLNIACTANDIDNDNLTYNYSFYKNNELNHTSDNSTYITDLVVGDIWNANCTVFDGENYSITKNSSKTILLINPLIDDIIINASFKSNEISCDNLDEFYLIDTNWDEANDSTKWNNYTNVFINFTYGFTNSTFNITLNSSTNRINLTKDFGLNCSKNNVLTYNFNFTNNGLTRKEERTIDLYYPTCKDLKFVSYYYIISSDSPTYDINKAEKLKIENTNNYSSNYFVNYTNINITLNTYLNGTNTSKLENNIFILENIYKNSNLIPLLSNISFNQTYAMLNNNTFNFSVDVVTDYNTFSCVLPVNYYDTKYPNVTVDITASSTSITNGQSVVLYLNITNYGENISRLSTKLTGCDIPTKDILATNESYLFNCTFSPQSSTDYQTSSTYGQQETPSDQFWIKEGSITINVNTNLDNNNNQDSSGGNSGLTGGITANDKTASITPQALADPTATNNDDLTSINVENEISKLPPQNPTQILDTNDKIDSNAKSSSSNVKINEMISNGVRIKKSYEYKDGKTIIKNSLKNGNILPQYDVYITIDIPKNVIPNTSLISGDFKILNFDPVIQFYYNKLDSGQEIILDYTINKTLSKEEIDKIITTINSSFSKNEVEYIETLANKTSQNLDFKTTVEKDFENNSIYTTNIEPKKDLKDVKVYLKIPKCLAEHLSEIEFDRKDYEIIEEDPLIAWSFDEINTPLALKFKTLKEVDKDCWEQIQFLPIAKEISEKLTKKQSWYFTFWPTLILLLTMLLAPYVSRHTDILKKDEHKDKHFLHIDILKELEFGIIESILVSLIIINLLEFFRIAPPIFGFIENTLQWGLILFMIYEISPTEIFFGKKSKNQDRLLILAYFGLVISDLITAIGNIQTEIIEQYASKSILFPFFNFVLLHSEIIMYIGFYLGILIIVTLSIFDFKKDAEKDSLLGILHEDGKITNIRKGIERALILLIIYTTFFLIFFKFFIEWFGMALNSVMVVLGIIIYVILFVKKHYEHFENDNFIYKVGTFGDDFWHSFLSYFKSKEKIIYGITGMLVLHLLVDLSNFMIPYLFNVGDSPYFMHLAANGILLNHTPLIPLLKNILTNASTFLTIKITLIYLFEIFAVIYFLILPAIVWYDLENKHELNPHRILNAIFLSAVALFYMMPLFKLTPILQNKIVGVDLSLLNIFEVTQNLDQKIALTIAVFIFVFLLSFDKRVNKAFMIIGVAFSQIFFLGYTYSYIVSWSEFFIESIKSMIIASHYLIAASFMLFFVIILLFYLIGFFSFTYIIIIHWAKQKLKIHDKKDNAMIKMIEYIENIKDINLAEKNLINIGWPKEMVHNAIINSFKLEEKMQKFICFEHQRKIQKNDAKNELINAGWDEELVDNILKKYW